MHLAHVGDGILGYPSHPFSLLQGVCRCCREVQLKQLQILAIGRLYAVVARQHGKVREVRNVGGGGGRC